jgi:anti-sigma B factor antagonist
MEFQISDLGVASKVTLLGRLDAPGVDKIETKFIASVVPGGRPIVVDCSGVTFVSSMGIRLLITTARFLSLRKAKMVLFGPQPLVRESFEHVSLDHLIPIAADETAALELLAT